MTSKWTFSIVVLLLLLFPEFDGLEQFFGVIFGSALWGKNIEIQM